ncbi:MAG: DinB family protein [Candidatus Acidiferrales bacterium]
MATAASAITNEVEIFRHNARTIHRVVRLNLDGVTQEESLIQPRPAGNCMNWVVGHLLWVYDRVLPLLGQTPVTEKDTFQRYARGSSSLHEAGEALDIQKMMAAWDTASERIDAGLAGLTLRALDALAPFSPSKNPNETVRSLLSGIFFHQAYHAGQTGILRRIAGKAGAIA